MPEEEQEMPVQAPGKGKMKTWLKRIGVAGFLFFLIKGLVWIAVFVFVGKSCGQ